VKHYHITVRGRRFEVRLLSDPRQQEVQVEVNGQTLTVEIEGIEAAPVAREATQGPATPAPSPALIAEPVTPAANTVIAPLPGTIKSIAIQPGQEVAAGDELLVIEAMKMDNVIRAPKTGVIDTVHVGAGRQVAHGERMLEYRA
jgi:biotin carboxyl carrier protein